jgi:hypothetical protein
MGAPHGSRFRRQKTAREFLRRQREQHLDGPSPDRVALVQALDEFQASEAFSPVAAVRATVAHRRRVRLTTLSVLGALLIAVPIAAFAANPRGNNPPPVPADSGSPVESPTPTPTPSPSGPAAQDARLTIDQLVAAKAPVPTSAKWQPCRDKVGPKPGSETTNAVFVAEVVYTNLDSDSAVETTALVKCQKGDGFFKTQVVGYDVGAAGQPVMLGAVVPTLEPYDIMRVSARDGGGVVVVVAWDEESPEPYDPGDQTREFAWNGSAFQQVAGPTDFVRP